MHCHCIDIDSVSRIVYCTALILIKFYFEKFVDVIATGHLYKSCVLLDRY